MGWMLLACMVGISCEQEPPIVIRDQGIVLTPDSYITSGTTKMYMSIFLRVKHPLIEKYVSKMLCFQPDNCIVSTQNYESHLGNNYKDECVHKGHNLKIAFIDWYVGLSFAEGPNSCIRNCLTNKECKGVQWEKSQKKCRLRSDRVDLDTIVLADESAAEFEVDIIRTLRYDVEIALQPARRCPGRC